MADFPLPGIGDDFRAPGQFARILFAQGPANAALAGRRAIVVMPQLSTSTTTAGTRHRIRTERQAIELAGAGSPAHRACRTFLQANKSVTELWLLAMDASEGAGLIQADGDITFATDPTGSGNSTVTIVGEEITTGFGDADTVTTLAAKVVLGINARTHLPVTAGSVAGVVTLTAKIGGASQGDGTDPVIRYRAEVTTGVGTTATTTGAALGLGTGTAGVDGATAESAQLTTALAGIVAERYYYMMFSDASVASLAIINLHIATKSEPKEGNRSVGIVGYNGALATSQSRAITENYERLQFVLFQNADSDPAQISGNVAAVEGNRFDADPAANLAGFTGTQNGWLLPPVFDPNDWLTADEANDAITDGVMAINSRENGSFITMLVNTRSKDPTGLVDDFRAYEAHRVSVADNFTDRILTLAKLNHTGKKLKDDAKLPDGSVDTNQNIPRGVVTPSLYQAMIEKEMRDEGDAQLLVDVQISIDNLIVQIDPNNSSRIESSIDIHAINHNHQMTHDVQEVSEG